MTKLLTAAAVALALTTGAAHAADDFNKCNMRAILKTQTNASAMMTYSGVVTGQVKNEIKAAINASDANRSAKVIELLVATVKAMETASKKPANAFVKQAAQGQVTLLVTTLNAAADANEPTMSRALIGNSIGWVIMTALSPCDM
jgi:hypothetical protein